MQADTRYDGIFGPSLLASGHTTIAPGKLSFPPPRGVAFAYCVYPNGVTYHLLSHFEVYRQTMFYSTVSAQRLPTLDNSIKSTWPTITSLDTPNSKMGLIKLGIALYGIHLITLAAPFPLIRV